MEFHDQGVRGLLDRAAGAAEDGLVLAHGAGSDCRAPLLAALAGAFAEAGLTVLRCDLPFRQLRPKGPPSGSAERDREGLRQAVTALRGIVAGRIYLGGHSYGGRQASILAAEEPELAEALLLLSYPLHPPERPSQLRTAHFPRLQTPALFVQGSRDPFGSTEELRSALPLIPARTELFEIDGAGHDLAKAANPAEIAAAFREFLEASEEGPVNIPVTDIFDLHTVPPKEVKAVVEAYLEEAHRLGFKALRIVHGRGIGVQREIVRAALARNPHVLSYGDAPPEAGGWGATVVTLR